MKQVRIYARHVAVALVLSSAAVVSQAALVTVTGLSTDGTADKPASPGAAAEAQKAFLQLVDPKSVRTEGFERPAFAPGETFQGASPPPLNFAPTAGGSTGEGTPPTGQLIPSAPLGSGSNDPPPPAQNPGLIASTATSTSFTGRFNTTGGYSNDTWASGKWWEATGDFDIEFASGVNAFGFYLTDSNDFLGRLDLVLIDKNGVDTTIADITGTSAAASGSLQFFGFFNKDLTYSKVRFDITQPTETAPVNFDVFGVDDMLIAAAKTDGPNPAPEPATLALAALSLGALAATRRRKTIQA